MANIFSIIGASLTMIWGISHLFPTKNVVNGFGSISEDNKRIIRMEWINEGITLIFIGMIIILTVIFTGSIPVYLSLSVIVMLLVLSVISLFTGFKIKFLPFRLCPVIFTLSAVLIGIGIIL